MAIAASSYTGARWLLVEGPASGRSPEAAPPVPPGDGPAIWLVDATTAAGLDSWRHFGGQRGNLIVEDMGSGVAVGDYDGDGDLDVFVPAVNALRAFQERQPRLATSVLLRNDGHGRFEDVTAQAGVAFQGIGMGALFADLDGDGLLDLLVTHFGPTLLYRNQGDGRFALVKDSGLTGPTFSAGVAVGDVDGDGDLDVYIPHYVEFDLRLPPAPPSQQNEPAPLPPRVQRMLVAEDEIFETPPPYGILPVNFRPQPNRLYRNEGNLRFTDITEAAGVADPEGRSLQSLLADLDDDGDLDLFVANDISYNRLYLNRGDGTFLDASTESGLLDPRGSMGATIADLDDDGRLDLVVANYSTDGLALYLSRPPVAGVPRYQRAEELARLTETTFGQVGWTPVLGDFDLDGDLDLYVSQGHIRNLARDPLLLGPQQDGLYRSLGGPVFEHLTPAQGGPGMAAATVGRGAVAADLDGDGDEDVLVVDHGQGLRLLRNDSRRGGGSLTVRLAAPGPNTQGIGARIRVGTGDRVQQQVVLGGDGYLGSGGTWKIFALPDGRPADWIEVRWPGAAGTKRYPGPFAPGAVVTLGP